jgi:hypothetical protein
MFDPKVMVRIPFLGDHNEIKNVYLNMVNSDIKDISVNLDKIAIRDSTICVLLSYPSRQISSFKFESSRGFTTRNIISNIYESYISIYEIEKYCDKNYTHGGNLFIGVLRYDQRSKTLKVYASPHN